LAFSGRSFRICGRSLNALWQGEDEVDFTDVAGNAQFMIIKTCLLFMVTAIAEIIGCFLPYVWLRKGGSVWLLVPAALSLAVSAWLLTMHPAASGRVYAAYGCVYVAIALLWLRIVDGVTLTSTDIIGGVTAIAGMLIIVSGWGRSI
jgi:small multidrug resistance family-3 protein